MLLKSVNLSKSPATVWPLPTDEDYDKDTVILQQDR